MLHRSNVPIEIVNCLPFRVNLLFHRGCIPLSSIPLQQRLTHQSNPLTKSQSAYRPQRPSLMSSQLPYSTNTKALPPLQSPYSISRLRKKENHRREREKKICYVPEQSKALMAPARTGHAEGTQSPLAPPSSSGNKPHRVALESTTLTTLGITACSCAIVSSPATVCLPICHWPHSRNRKWRLSNCQRRIHGSRNEKHNATVSAELEAPSPKSKHLRVSYIASRFYLHASLQDMKIVKLK